MPRIYSRHCGIGYITHILEAVRLLGLSNKTRIYQASTSELYGWFKKFHRLKKPLLSAKSVGVAKLYAYWITVNYRESYGIYARNGILFNHKSLGVAKHFSSEKLLEGCSELNGIEKCLFMGNLDSKEKFGSCKRRTDAMAHAPTN